MVPQLGKVDEMGLLRLKSANQRLMWKSLLSPSPTGKKKKVCIPWNPLRVTWKAYKTVSA